MSPAGGRRPSIGDASPSRGAAGLPSPGTRPERSELDPDTPVLSLPAAHEGDEGGARPLRGARRLTETERRAFEVERRLGGLLARLLGKRVAMRHLGAKRLVAGTLWLSLARRSDRRGVVYDLAAVLRARPEIDLETGRRRVRHALTFEVTHAPGGDPDAADTERWPDAAGALEDFYRSGPFWRTPEG